MWCRQAILIFIIGLVGRLIFFRLFNYTPWIYNDEPGYLLGARALLNGEVLTQPLSHNFPIGFSVLLLPAVILTKNPIWQYQIGLFINSAIASLVGVVIYLATRKTLKSKAFLAGVLVSFYPPLFVYSGALMSEVSFALVLVTFTLIYFYQKPSLKKILGLSLLLIFLAIIRSAGLTVAAAFYFSWLIKALLAKKRKYLLWGSLSLGLFVLFTLINKYILFLSAGHYQADDYLTRMGILFDNPLGGLTLLFNNTAVFVFMLFGLIFVTYKDILKKTKKNIAPISFVVILVLGNILLAATHSARQALVLGNNGYLLAFRYLSPFAVVAYCLLLVNFLKNISNAKINYFWLALFGLCLIIFF